MENKPKKNESVAQFLQTDAGRTKSNAIEIPSITLPKGGGAIKGIDEKFSVNAVNGTASFSIAVPFSQSRGANPSINLSYNSGGGNSIFGLGWNVGLSSIKRKTDNGLPQYFDGIDSDTFLFSGSEDLVPEFTKDLNGKFVVDAEGEYVIKEKNSGDGLFRIRFYKPRIEGLFARIERWSDIASQQIRWRVISKDNITTLFGWSAGSRIADPRDSRKIFEWLPEFVFDDKGNCAHYIYKREDDKDFDNTKLHNSNRRKDGSITYTNLYLSKVLHGNKIPYKKFGDALPAESTYLFSAIFDYGTLQDGDAPDVINDWDFRKDAFSNYKAGFEIRTTRLCKRVLIFHHFTGPNEYEGLVRSLNFTYDTTSMGDFTHLKAVTSFGYIKLDNGTYSQKNLPPLEFTYQEHEWNKEIKTISPGNIVHAPAGLDEQQYQFTDLYNEGLSGILTEQANGWYYKHNLGEGQFSNAKLVSPKPSFNGLGQSLQLADLDGDGGKQLVSFAEEPKGYFELDDDNEWKPYRNFETLPNINFTDPYIRMFDLNGDGKPELVISEEAVFSWYASEGRNGFSQGQKSSKSFDEESGAAIIFSDEKQSLFLADMSGDGLTDIVRIRNGEVCYWPNMGYGKFGKKVNMDNAPWFDNPGAFNPSNLRLADINGSGTTDIIYLGKNKFTCWMNLSGNSFNISPFEIDPFPEINTDSKITLIDLLGNGVSCIVWSSLLFKNNNAAIKYVDLMNSKKPHLMVFYKNNFGKEVSLEYSPSTKFYLEDKLAGKPWATKLHFPVHCISQTETRDRITGHRFVSSFKYHHGYYDHPEREFRGFGMIEQIDSEDFEHWEKGNASNILDKELHQEPVVSKSWFHTGAFLSREKILSQFADEYWYEEMNNLGFPVVHHELPLPDAKLIFSDAINTSSTDVLSIDEWRQAFRACKGMNLRSEVFAKDAVKNGNTPEAIQKELTPYTVATHNCMIELLQPKGKNRHAIFIVKESEAITYSYERNAADPRIDHSLNIQLDEYGNVLESASVVYQRVLPDLSLPSETRDTQNKTIVTYTKNNFTNAITDDALHPDDYRLPLPSETKTFELKGVAKAGTFYTPDGFKEILMDANSDPTEYFEIDKPAIPGKAQRRLIEHVRSTYYSNNLSGPLPLHQLESLAVPFESYQLAYTPALLNDIFGAKVNTALMNEGKFTESEGDNNWWIRSGNMQFIEGAENDTDAGSRFFVPISFTDPYGAETSVKYYSDYFLFIEETTDAFDNKSSVDKFNFRTLSPQRMKGINANISEAITDELGLVKAMALLGKGNEADDLTGLNDFTDVAERSLVNNFFNGPLTPQGITDSVALLNMGAQLLQHATGRYVYDFDIYKKNEDQNKLHIANGEPENVKPPQPVVIASIVREDHFVKNNNSPVQLSFEYSSSIGKVVMKKVQAEPGIAKKINVADSGNYNVDTITTTPLLRWVGNGRTIVNNKGNPVKIYEPYFSVNNQYEDFKELVETGVTPIMYYDAAGRLVKTEIPDGTFSKVEFDSWKQAVYDANDTILESSWYTNRTNRLIDSQLIAEGKDPAREKIAADKGAKHANTPNVLHFDTLGRPVLSIDYNKNITTDADEFFRTKVQLDSEGNLRSVVDAREIPENGNMGNMVMQYKYDMLGNMVYHKSMDAGQRWLLINIAGKPLRTWDERNHEFQYFYDIMQRPLQSKVTGGDGTTPLDNIFDRIIYGESLLLPGRTNEVALQAKNILGKPVQHFDTGGLSATPEYDFKGQPPSVTRRLFKNYKSVANWTDAVLNSDLEADNFIFSTDTDALGRIIKQTTPDGSIITPSYNEAGLLNSETVTHVNPALITTYIKDIDYNEKGQRNKIMYGNDVTTKFYYDKETFRLNRLESKRQNNDPMQDLYYTFDAAGNITHIEDKNIPVVFFNNQKVTGISEYTYDALYRLAEAKGRENDAALNFNNSDNWNDASFIHLINPNDPMAIRNYTQTFLYDDVGNIRQMKHAAGGNNWIRDYNYEKNNNRLINTSVGQGVSNFVLSYIHHPAHGFITAMPHLEEMDWSFKEELIRSIRQKRNDGGTPETTYYQYDGQGQRIRKITENAANAGAVVTKKEERIYISGYELYKKHSGPDAGLERVSLSLIDQGHRFVMIETRNDVDDGTEKRLIRYQLYNHMGSAALELDYNAQVISYEEYHPFGTTAYQASNTNIKSAAKRYRYTGMERDEETGLEYHSARYFLPWLGRWLSADPAGLKSDINVYCYCGGKVITYTDVNGKYDKPGHDILTRLQATQYMSDEDAVKLGRAANASDMIDEYGAGATSSMKNKEELHSLKDQPEEATRNEIRAKMKNFEFSSDPEVALKQFGAYFLHPFQDTYAHTRENLSIPGVTFFGHFSNPEADLIVGNKSEETFIKERKEWDEFIKSAKEVDSLKGFFKDRKEITEKDWKKIYRDLKSAEKYEAIKSDTGRDVLIAAYSVVTAVGITGAGVALAMQFGNTTAGGIGAALTVLGFAGLGLTTSILGSLGIARLAKSAQTNKAFEEEAKVLDKYLGKAQKGDEMPSSSKTMEEYCKKMNTNLIEYCTPN